MKLFAVAVLLLGLVFCARGTQGHPNVALLEEAEEEGRLMTKYVGEANYESMKADPITEEQTAAAVTKGMTSKEDQERMLKKPPGCRPQTVVQLYNYKANRAKCASTRPSPSAETKPPTQVCASHSITIFPLHFMGRLSFCFVRRHLSK